MLFPSIPQILIKRPAIANIYLQDMRKGNNTKSQELSHQGEEDKAAVGSGVLGFRAADYVALVILEGHINTKDFTRLRETRAQRKLLTDRTSPKSPEIPSQTKGMQRLGQLTPKTLCLRAAACHWSPGKITLKAAS